MIIVYYRDGRGLVTQRTDARGITFAYTYDAAWRILTETNSANASDNITYAYDQAASGSYPLGHLTSVTDASGSLQRVYDQKGRVWQETRTTGTAPALGLGYAYDLSGNLTSLTFPSGHQVAWSRDAMGRVNSVAVQGGSGFPSPVSVASPVSYAPYGHPLSLTFGNGLIGTYGLDTDYHVVSVAVGPPGGSPLVSKTLSWTGETLDSIADSVTPANSESLTYTNSHRLASASGAYGSLAWTYDASGNRATQVVNGATQTYAISAVSNELNSITQSGAPTRSLTYDASGERSTDTTSGIAQALSYDGHGNLAGYQNAGVTEGAYGYDAFHRLVQRVVSNVSPSGTTQYYYDPYGHVVLETDGSGNSLREYIWLDDMPIGIIDQVNTSPVLYYVHADWLDRPIMVTDGTGAPVWSAIWTPFGTPYSITGALTYNARFPGQWFQIESGLNWNWHRHYDPSTGAYVQPDPYSTEFRDQTQAGVMAGAPISMGYPTEPVRGAFDAMARSGAAIAGLGSVPRQPAVAADLLFPGGDAFKGTILGNAVFADGPNSYSYARSDPTGNVDSSGLFSNFTPVPQNLSDVQLCARKKRPVFWCQSIICGAPTGGTTYPLCVDCATKLLSGTTTTLENNTILPGGTNLFPQ